MHVSNLADVKLFLQIYIGLLVFILSVKCRVEEHGYCTKLDGCNENELEEKLDTLGKGTANNRILIIQ